ncbi:hypothetical protein HGA91_00550 [candidate division WWE3 bacterium]|nr:hypothetical protein [candidate division WWE3 bacterium]
MRLKENRGDVSLALIIVVVVLVLGAGAYLFFNGSLIDGNEVTPTPTTTTNTPSPTVNSNMKPYTQAGVDFSIPTDWYIASFSTDSHLFLYSFPEDKSNPALTYDSVHPAPQGEAKFEILNRSKSSSIALEEWLKTRADNYDYFGDRNYSIFEKIEIGNTSGFKLVSSMSSQPFYVFQNGSGDKYFIISGNEDSVYKQTLEQLVSSVKA